MKGLLFTLAIIFVAVMFLAAPIRKMMKKPLLDSNGGTLLDPITKQPVY